MCSCKWRLFTVGKRPLIDYMLLRMLHHTPKEYDFFVSTTSVPKDLTYFSGTLADQDPTQAVATLNYIARKILKMSLGVLPIPHDGILFLLVKKEEREYARAKIQNTFLNLTLQCADEENTHSVPRILLEQALRYFIWLQLYPHWFRVKNNLFIYGSLSRDVEVRPCVELRLNLLDDNHVYFLVKSTAVRLKQLKLKDLLGNPEYNQKSWQRFETNNPLSAEELIECTCVVLPHLTPSRIAFLRREPSSINFDSWNGFSSQRNFLKYWRNTYQIAISPTEEAYASIQLRGSHSQLLTYPLSCCWHSFGIVESKSRTQQAKEQITCLMLKSLSQLQFNFTSSKRNEQTQSLFKFDQTLKFMSLSEVLNNELSTWKSSASVGLEQILNPSTHMPRVHQVPEINLATPIINQSAALAPLVTSSKLKSKSVRLEIKPWKSQRRSEDSNLSSSPAHSSYFPVRKSSKQQVNINGDFVFCQLKKQKTEVTLPSNILSSHNQFSQSTKSDHDNINDIKVKQMVISGCLHQLSIPQLKMFLRQHKLPVGGKKQDLVDRIVAFLSR